MFPDWMGNHREIVEALIRYCNAYASVYRVEELEYNGIRYSYAQIQVLDYLLANEGLCDNMRAVAKRLGFRRSHFTKAINRLLGKGLVEKAFLPGSSRDINVTVTALGKALYEDYYHGRLKRQLAPLLRDLDRLSPDAQACVRDALVNAVNEAYSESSETTE